MQPPARWHERAACWVLCQTPYPLNHTTLGDYSIYLFVCVSILPSLHAIQMPQIAYTMPINAKWQIFLLVLSAYLSKEKKHLQSVLLLTFEPVDPFSLCDKTRHLKDI